MPMVRWYHYAFSADFGDSTYDMTQDDALLILRTGANVFLTGEPGAGKTHTVNAYVRWLRSHGIEPAITASTGIAATHLHGMTIHSWSGIGVLDTLTPSALDHISQKEHVVKRIQKTQVLIIDEVSMLSGTLLDMLDMVLRTIKHSQHPFGGMQVVLVGDFFQLPPISRSSHIPFAFEAASWRSLNPIICYLEEQHRQEDGKFLNLLSAIRAGATDHTHVSLIMSRETDLDGIDEDTPRLFTHNADVDRINADKLRALSGRLHTYEMDTKGGTSLIESLKRGCLSPEKLDLKEGAVVMATKNNPIAGYANGTLGVITGFERGTEYPIMETRDGRSITVAPADWNVEDQGKIRATISQIPLRLAWAITIHKSQGQSLDAAAIDLSRAFEYGQGYVALSRVRTLDGLSILGWSERALELHPLVRAIDAEFKEASRAAKEIFASMEAGDERLPMEESFIKACGGTLEVQKVEPGEKVSKGTTYDETLALLLEKKPIADIVATRKLTFGTICDHIEKLTSTGRVEVSLVHDLISESLLKALPDIYDAFEKKGYEKLSPVFAKTKGKYTYDELKLARILYSAEQ